jgi:hypothetical protein
MRRTTIRLFNPIMGPWAYTNGCMGYPNRKVAHSPDYCRWHSDSCQNFLNRPVAEVRSGYQSADKRTEQSAIQQPIIFIRR